MSADPRVAIFTASLTRQGGTELYVRAALAALRAQALPFRVYTHDALPPGVPGAALGPLFTPTLRPRRLLARRGEVRELARRIAGEADVVMLHSVVSLDLVRALSRRVPTVLSLHVPQLVCPAGNKFLPRSKRPCPHPAGPGCLMVDRTEGCLSLTDGTPFPLSGRARVLLSRPTAAAIRRWTAGVLFNSQALRDVFLREMGAPRRHWVVHPPLGPPAAAEGGAREPRRIAFVGRLVPFKGAADAVRLLPRLEADVHLDILGDGPERTSLERLAHDLGLEERVRFHGWCDAERVQRTLETVGCLVVPSRWFEAFGQVGPQAIRAGCPVVAYDAGGIREWCLPQFGSIVAVGDGEALAREVRRWTGAVAAGLPTSGWSAEANARWGDERFGREYLGVVRAAAEGASAPD